MVGFSSQAVSKLPRILIVDDNAAVLASLALCLQFSDFQVATAANLPEALGLISKEPFDVLLCDLHFPRAKDGLAVVTAMRQSHPETIILLLSGDTGSGDISAFNLSSSDLLMKPVTITHLVKVIRDRLARRERASA
jgi:DNA-binding response OmpR family regulator